MQALSAEQLGAQPKYVQKYIAELERRIIYLRGQLDAARSGPADSNVRIRHSGDEPDQRLGKGTTVTFDMKRLDVSAPAGQRRLSDGRITVRHNSPVSLEIMGVSDQGAGTLHVVPGSSNVIKVRLGEW